MICPICNSTNVRNGYGEWTNVYISTDNLADEVSLTAEKSTIKNSFKVIGGDDNITNRIPSVNPNGTGYIIKFSDLQYNDMPIELVNKLKAYETLCKNKKGEYKNLTLNICDCIDQILYYQSGMMPSPDTAKTNATQEIKNITNDLSLLMANTQAPNTIGLNTFSEFTTVSLVNNAIISYVKILLSPDYEVSITSSTYSFKDTYGVWEGILHVNSISYPDIDFADSEKIILKVDGNGIAYITQKIDKALATKDLKDQIYDYTLYSVDALQNFIDAYDICEGILVDHGDSAMAIDTPQYAIYDKYRTLKETVIIEQQRKQEIVTEWTHKKETYETQQKAINDALNLQNYLGDNLFKLYCAYRRDDKYQNNNYISDGLSDADLLKQSEKLLEVADKELEIACHNQYSLTTTLNNLFLMEEFAPFHEKCRLGNWIYVEINDSVFILRLVKIGIDYESLDQVTVEFSNVKEIYNTSKSIKNILSDAQSIAASYPATIKQISDDSKVISQVNNWVDNGLNATNMMIANSPVQNTVLDENGIWCRGYDEITGDFEPTQLRIVNSTLAVTDDNWKTTKAAIGKYIMQDPVTGEYKYAMGVIGETIVGKLLLGENLGIYNGNQSMIFNKNGLKITNDRNTFVVNPNSTELLSLSNSKEKILYVDENGVLHIQGDGAGLDLSLNNSVTELSNQLSITASGLEGKITAVDGRVTTLSTTVDGISTEVADKVSTSVFTQKSNEIDASIKTKVGNNEVIAKINASTEGILISGNKINITGLVTFDSFSNDLQNNINTISDNASSAKLKTDGLANGTTIINGGCITTGTIDANKVTLSNLEVGKNVTMGTNATISWNNVTNQPTIPTNTNQLINGAGFTTMTAVENKGYQTASQVTQITKDTVTTSYVNALKVTAGSVAAENITGTTITGKTIAGSNMSGCAGDFTSIFLYNKNKPNDYQHGSICGQYVTSSGAIEQHELIRINNTDLRSYMSVYENMEFINGSYPIFSSMDGIQFGSLGTDFSFLPLYMRTLSTRNASGTGALRIGFIDTKATSGEVPAFEVYDNYNVGENNSNHIISAEVFGNLIVDGTVSNKSSIRYKTNIQSLSDTTALKLLNYDIVSFDYIDGRKNRHGMIAEQAVKISEYGVVRNNDNEPDAIGYIDFIPDIIKLNQIMYKEIQELKRQIYELKGA